MNRAQALASLQAFLPEDKEIVKIVNLCDLQPNETWRVWENQYSPYLKVQKNKKLVTLCKGTDFFSPKTDLYAYASPEDVANISDKLLFLAEGNCFCFLFWGKDNLLRYRRYLDGLCCYDPPLFLPIEDIRTLVKHEKIEGHIKITPSKGQKTIGWVTSWPPKKSFHQDIVKETQICKNPQIDSLILDSLV